MLWKQIMTQTIFRLLLNQPHWQRLRHHRHRRRRRRRRRQQQRRRRRHPHRRRRRPHLGRLRLRRLHLLNCQQALSEPYLWKRAVGPTHAASEKRGPTARLAASQGLQAP